MSQRKPKDLRKRPDSKVVGFKLDDENLAKLTAQAKDLGTKPNLLARGILLKAMNESTDFMGGLVTLNQQLFAMREELALIAEVLLSDAGKRTREEAQKWADENIKPN